MRVLVSGAEGFTGRYLCAALEAHGHEALPLAADVTDAAALEAAVERAAPDAIIHLAALAFVHSDDFSAFYRVNQLGTFNLLAAAEKFAPGARILLASSANIYGNRAAGYLNEDTPPDPVNHYGVSKWAMEIGASLWMDRLDITIVRPFNYTGVGQEDRYLIPKIVDHFRRREPSIELGNLDVRRDFGDVRSVVGAYLGLVLSRPRERIFNICTGEVHSISDILAMARELTGHAVEVRVNPQFVRANEVAVLAGDPARLKAALPDWQAHDLRETLAWMLAA